MNSPLPENSADLRVLYRVSEARSARLRLLFDAARDLATADNDRLGHYLQLGSERAAHFLGYAHGRLFEARPLDVGPGDRLLELHAMPGASACGFILLEAGSGGSVHPDDLEAVSVLCQLMAARIMARNRDAERDRLLLELADRESRLALLVERMISDDEHARRRLAADLHDSVAQVASAAVRRLEIVDDIRELLPAAASVDLDRGLELVRQTLREIRGVIQGLRPVTLESLGLAAALKEELPRLIDLPVSVVAADLPAGRPAIEVELALFRCAQEAVHNVRKHARACTRIEVRLFAAKDHLTLEIINDGDVVTLPTADSPAVSTHGQGLGLLMMRERIAAIGGCAQIAPNEGGGATVRIEVNLPAETGKGI